MLRQVAERSIISNQKGPINSMSQHTPGPWKVEEVDGYITGHITAEAHTYCGNTVGRKDSVTAPDSMTRADAYLIAAAPDLLAACQDVIYQDDFYGSTVMRQCIDAIKAAIRKATSDE